MWWEAVYAMLTDGEVRRDWDGKAYERSIEKMSLGGAEEAIG